MNPINQYQNAYPLLPSIREASLPSKPSGTRADRMIKHKLHCNTVSEGRIKKNTPKNESKNTNVELVHLLPNPPSNNIEASIHQEEDSIKIVPEKREISKVSSSLEIHKKYFNSQIILNFVKNKFAEKLTGHTREERPDMPSKTITLKGSRISSRALAILKTQMNQLSHSSKVYIIGHCNKGRNRIRSDWDSKILVEDFVKIFDQIPQLKKTTDDQKITISLIACYAATDSLKDRCFASQLSQKLAMQGIPANVIGRRATIRLPRFSSNNYKVMVSDCNYHKDLYKFSYNSEIKEKHTVETTVKVFDYSKKTWNLVEVYTNARC